MARQAAHSARVKFLCRIIGGLLGLQSALAAFGAD